MAKAKKLPSGSWRCLVYDYTDEFGKRHYKSFTSNNPSPAGKREAELLAAEYAAEKETKKISGKNIEFKDALSEYILKKEPVLSPSTIRGYKNIENGLLKNYANFCSLKVCDIEPDHIQELINELSTKRTPKTVRNYHGLISSVLSSNGSNLKLNTTMPKKVRPDLYIPSDADIKKLVQAVKDTELEIPVLLGAFCTMRRGEICGLSIDDIDGNIIHVHHSLVQGADKELHLKTPKTESSDRYIEAPSFVIEKIQKQGYVTKLKPHSITIMFQRVLNNNNIPHFRFHDLRHYSASVQHALGIPDAYIMQRGGWSSDTVLKSVYRHAMNDRQKEMNQKTNSHFEELCNTKCNTKK